MRGILRLLAAVAVISLAACGKTDTAADAAVADAGAADGKLPPAVEKALADYVQVCTEVGGKPDSTSGIRRADLNADGVTDYVLNGHEISCVDAYSAWGDRAKQVRVFAGDGKGDAAEAFTDLTWGATFEGEGKDTKLWLGNSGESCGKPPAPTFAEESFCDRQILWNAASGKFDYAPVSTVRMIE